MLMVAGGEADPNILCLARRLALEGLPHLVVCAGIKVAPAILWHLGEDCLWINGVEVDPSAMFLRYDVFSHLKDPRPERQQRASNWYQTMLSWALAHDEVAFFNRRYGTRQSSKPHVLQLASRLGLAIPDTLVTNDAELFANLDDGEWIAKPVTGGEYAVVLSDALSDANWRRRWDGCPAIIQRRMVAPDLRVYRVGEAWFAFTLRSDKLDYRIDTDVAIAMVPPPADLIGPLGQLMDQLGLDFAAADFKRCPHSGAYRFLEVNSAPMFAAFDRIASGALVAALLNTLTMRLPSQPS